ncbi:hypothetical protein [Streptomyces bacillaris]|uniref:hypothetical protein n=1 Tax=Streptomyces bacillaris TaxID=68179 RepID=UPI0036FD010A
MRAIHGVGAVAAGVVVAVVLSGCGSDEGKPVVGLSPSAAPSTEVAEPEELEEPTPEPVYPVGPEGEIDELADEKGWVVDDLYESASGFVQDICDSLPTSAAGGASRPQWLAESGQLEGDGAAVLTVGVPKLCPEWSKAVKQAVAGKYERWFGDGTYVVSSKPPTAEEAEAGVVTIPPGTYRAKGRMEDCYWERTSKGGEIIDNQFATSAQSITVTIAPSDGQFTAERCEVWKPVK